MPADWTKRSNGSNALNGSTALNGSNGSGSRGGPSEPFFGNLAEGEKEAFCLDWYPMVLDPRTPVTGPPRDRASASSSGPPRDAVLSPPRDGSLGAGGRTLEVQLLVVMQRCATLGKGV
ncbi:hypothetical protein T484DRAFT_1975712 [Baffinella frigidus]|nr:hypothetical protein T484DRAFT_1975712 [Cryptophyta sp. CCMP2293]